MGDDSHVYWFVEDERESCPVCGREVDQDEWIEDGVAAGYRGGSATYQCPTDGCEGTASVQW